MEIDFLTQCDAATDSQGKLNILGAFETIITQSVPAKHPSMAIVLRVRIEPEDEIIHKFNIELQNANDEPLGPKLQGEFAVQRRRPDRPVNANLIMNIIGFEFKDYGEYKVVASVGEILKKSTSFFVEKTPDTPHQEVEIR